MDLVEALPQAGMLGKQAGRHVDRWAFGQVGRRAGR